MRRFQWWTPKRWIQRRSTNSSIHHNTKISYTSLSIHSTPISSYNVYTPPHQYYDNFGNLSLWGERRYSAMSSSILPRIHIDALSYAQYPLQLKLLQSRWFSSNHRGRGNRRNQDPDMRVCQSIDELTQMAYEHKDSMSPRGMAAYWTLVSKLLRQRSNNRPSNQMQIQIDELIGETLRSCEIYNYRDLATIAISLAKIINKVRKSNRKQHKGNTEQILYDVLIGKESKNKQVIFNYIASTSVPILHEFDTRSLSNLIYAYGLAEEVVLVENGSTYFDMLAEEVLSFDGLVEFWPQALSNIVYAYANVKVSNSQLFKKIGDHIVGLDNLNEFWPQALSNTVWAYATSDEQHPKLFKKIADHIVTLDTLDTFIPQHCSNTVWAYATLDEQHTKLFKKLADHIVQLDNLNDFKPQAFSNTMWAFATLDEQHPELLKKVANHIVTLDSLDRYDPQALANILWAFATAEEQHPQLYKKVGDHIVGLDNLNNFEPQELSNILWAFATAGEQHLQLFKRLGDHIITLDLDKFEPQAIKDIVWAFAKAGEAYPQLFEKIADHIISLPRGLDEFKPQALSNILWAFATASESHPHLFKKLADEAIKRQHEFTPQGVANFLWAYATNGQVDEHLFSSLVPSLKDNLDKYTAQELIIAAWAYSVANVDAPSVFKNDFINACLIRKKENDFIVEDFRQLHQWQLWQDEMKSDVSLPSSLQKKCYEAFISRVPEPSKLQGNVVSILSSMGLQPQEEVLLKSGYRIDAVVEVDGKQIAVEVDGPSHFIGRSKERTGSTILKHRQVAALDGLKVKSVPYWEWIKLKNDNSKKQQYLRSLLDIKLMQ